MLKLPSSRQEFAGFDQYFETDLAPVLAAHEGRRRNAMGAAGVVLGIAALIALTAAIFLSGDWRFVIPIIIGILGAVAGGAILNRARGEITDDVMSRVADQIGVQYKLKCSRPEFLSDCRRLDLLPRFDEDQWEDRIDGARRGADFSIIEGHLKKVERDKDGEKKRTVFHGQVLVIDYHQEFLGETIIKRDAGLFNALTKPGKSFQRVGLASPKFEKIFEAWSTDQVEARELLDPVMLERFEELDRVFDKAKLRAAFSTGRLYVALETGDKINIGTMLRAIDGPERIEKILKEIDLVFDLIDVATKKLSTRIDGAFSVDAIKES